MKKTLKISVSLIIALMLVLCAVACAQKVPAQGLWENATYRSDTTLGKGDKTVYVDVEVGEYKVTLTLKTDAATLGEALYAEGLINDASFFDTCNGIKADWNADQAYWGFYQGEDYMPHGVNDENISGGESYRIVYTK